VDSPFFRRLVEQRDRAIDPIGRALGDAEIAIYQTRLGEYEPAHETASRLRAEFGDGRSGRVSIMLMVLEALLAYFKDLSPTTHDRIARAQLLSRVGRDRQLTVFTSAWLAHVDFNLGRYGEMTRALTDCFGAVAPDDTEALCRVALTLGDAFLYCEDHEASRAWYAIAHQHATGLGDHASIGALTYNKAALQVFGARLRLAQGPMEPGALARLSGDLKSAVNYQAIARLRSLQSLFDRALVSLRILMSDYAGALKALQAIIGEDVKTAFFDSLASLKSDAALCYSHVGRQSEAVRAVAEITRGQLESLASDDRAIAAAALAEACERCSLPAERDGFRELCQQSLQEHANQLTALRASLAPYRSTVEALSF
jgi:hypothetical protein